MGQAEPIRIAVYHTELSRDGPGLLYRDILRGKDKQVAAVAEVIRRVNPDVLVLWSIDWDYEGRAINAFSQLLMRQGLDFPHIVATQPNRGIPTGLDLDGNGRSDDPEDAQSYGEFTGQSGLAVLSRWPVTEQIDFSQMLWSELPNSSLPWPGQPEGVAETLRLSSTAHWLIRLHPPDIEDFWLGAFAATTPVFDGPEDRNGRRNHDEIAFWERLLDGDLAQAVSGPLVIAGHANLDPWRGEGRHEAIGSLIDRPGLQDPHDANSLTVDWKRDDLEQMRLSYVLPDQSWDIVDAGVFWPQSGTDLELVEAASRHRLVWVEITAR